ncbi:hypothetical protein BLX87_20680 [Bacillus sp. VT-16-64]|nr:hypothetical protein BLX87_20680 [Bacillus sp. VT-16-64]
MFDKLLQCLCESRRTQAFYTKCLNEAVTEEEKDFLGELVKDATRTSNDIKKFFESMPKEK